MHFKAYGTWTKVSVDPKPDIDSDSSGAVTVPCKAYGTWTKVEELNAESSGAVSVQSRALHTWSKQMISQDALCRVQENHKPSGLITKAMQADTTVKIHGVRD